MPYSGDRRMTDDACCVPAAWWAPPLLPCDATWHAARWKGIIRYDDEDTVDNVTSRRYQSPSPTPILPADVMKDDEWLYN